MKTFEAWTRDLAEQVASPVQQPLFDELAVGEEKGLSLCDGIWIATCKCCDKDYALPCSVEEFNEDMSYCGGSPSCCP